MHSVSTLSSASNIQLSLLPTIFILVPTRNRENSHGGNNNNHKNQAQSSSEQTAQKSPQVYNTPKLEINFKNNTKLIIGDTNQKFYVTNEHNQRQSKEEKIIETIEKMRETICDLNMKDLSNLETFIKIYENYIMKINEYEKVILKPNNPSPSEKILNSNASTCDTLTPSSSCPIIENNNNNKYKMIPPTTSTTIQKKRDGCIDIPPSSPSTFLSPVIAFEKNWRMFKWNNTQLPYLAFEKYCASWNIACFKLLQFKIWFSSAFSRNLAHLDLDTIEDRFLCYFSKKGINSDAFLYDTNAVVNNKDNKNPSLENMSHSGKRSESFVLYDFDKEEEEVVVNGNFRSELDNNYINESDNHTMNSFHKTTRPIEFTDNLIEEVKHWCNELKLLSKSFSKLGIDDFFKILSYEQSVGIIKEWSVDFKGKADASSCHFYEKICLNCVMLLNHIVFEKTLIKLPNQYKQEHQNIEYDFYKSAMLLCHFFECSKFIDINVFPVDYNIPNFIHTGKKGDNIQIITNDDLSKIIFENHGVSKCYSLIILVLYYIRCLSDNKNIKFSIEKIGVLITTYSSLINFLGEIQNNIEQIKLNDRNSTLSSSLLPANPLSSLYSFTPFPVDKNQSKSSNNNNNYNIQITYTKNMDDFYKILIKIQNHCNKSCEILKDQNNKISHNVFSNTYPFGNIIKMDIPQFIIYLGKNFDIKIPESWIPKKLNDSNDVGNSRCENQTSVNIDSKYTNSNKDELSIGNNSMAINQKPDNISIISGETHDIPLIIFALTHLGSDIKNKSSSQIQELCQECGYDGTLSYEDLTKKILNELIILQKNNININNNY